MRSWLMAPWFVVFRKEVLENMERERDRALQRRFNARVMEALSAAHEVELPKTYVSKDDYNATMVRIEKMVARIDEKLDGKADKHWGATQ